jgi:hypothetical protein
MEWLKKILGLGKKEEIKETAPEIPAVNYEPTIPKAETSVDAEIVETPAAPEAVSDVQSNPENTGSGSDIE